MADTDIERCLSDLARSLRRDCHRFELVADRQAIGTLVILPDMEGLDLHLIIVAAEYRRKGVGRHLMNSLIACADRHSVKIILSVLPFHPADEDWLCAFYREFGFEVDWEHCQGGDLAMRRHPIPCPVSIPGRLPEPA
ncbi:GNAT family N-acetyltransferase [Paracoccus litorisediminis]|uniref:GNAT family N-acetyltransferase n=1 Tax=Paracoccus litorisediminis TaxID=2006130 RepID=UPI0037313A49